MLQTIIDFGKRDLFCLSFTPRIYGYGLMLVLGFLSGIWLAHWRAKRMGENHETVTVVGILSLVGGIIGARLAFIIQNWSEFAKSNKGLAGIIDVTSGGLIYYGGVLLATLMVICYLWRKRIAIRRYLDIVAVSLMVGLAFGRAGCFLNGCCYGGQCDADWPLATRFPMYSRPLLKFDGRPGNPFSVGTGASPVYAHQMEKRLINPDTKLVKYTRGGKRILLPPESFSDEQIRIASASRSLPVRPAQALGFFNALLIAALLGVFFRHRRREGQVFAVLLVIYPITRFLLEYIRSDTTEHFGMTHNQYTSLATVAAGLIMLFVISKLPPSAGPTWAQRLAADAQHSAPQPLTKREKRKR